MQYTKKSFQVADSFPATLIIDGNFIASQKEHRSWVKDGVQKDMDVVCLFIQCPIGVVVCRCFNPTYDFADFKQGDKIFIPVNEYKVENGVKSVSFRLG